MAEGKQYGAVGGFVQFDVKSRDTKVGAVRSVTVRAFGSQKLVDISLFPQWEAVEVKKGDLVFADGESSSNSVQKDDGSTTVYYNLNAYKLVVNGAAQVAKERDTVGVTASASEPAPF